MFQRYFCYWFKSGKLLSCLKSVNVVCYVKRNDFIVPTITEDSVVELLTTAQLQVNKAQDIRVKIKNFQFQINGVNESLKYKKFEGLAL